MVIISLLKLSVYKTELNKGKWILLNWSLMALSLILDNFRPFISQYWLNQAALTPTLLAQSFSAK